MYNTTRSLLLAIILGCVSGCLAYPPTIPSYKDTTIHYQGVERFDRIVLDVSSASMNDDLASSITDAAAQYLELNGISVVATDSLAPDPAAKLSLHITRRSPDHVIYATLSAPDGSVVIQTPLILRTESVEGIALAQYLATLVVDDLLLLWYPAKSVAGIASTARPTKFALLVDDLPRQTTTGDTTFSWEAFPSSRLLKASGLSADDISDVSYELRIHRAGTMVVFYRHTRSLVYRHSGIRDNRFTLPFSLPSCEAIVWSVRARFTLANHTRLTEWSGYSSTIYNRIGPLPALPPYVHRRAVGQNEWGPIYQSFPMEHHTGSGTRERIIPPKSVKCGELDRGFYPMYGASTDAVINTPLGPLQADEAIGITAVANRICVTESCVLEDGKEDVTDEVVSCLAREFRRRSLDVPVIAYDPANAEQSRYVFDFEFEVVEDGTEKYLEEGDVVGFLGDPSVSPVTDYTTTVHYSAHLTATVIDGRTGEELGRIGTRDAGMRSKSVGFLLFIPVWYIPINTMGDIEDNACDNVARRLSFALRGGVSTGWPSRYFKTIGSPIWE